MKNIVLHYDTIGVQYLTGREIVCYLSTKTNTPKILAKLSVGKAGDPDRWGFISIAYPTGDIVFEGQFSKDAIIKALNGGRKLYAFDSYREFKEFIGSQDETRNKS